MSNLLNRLCHVKDSRLSYLCHLDKEAFQPLGSYDRRDRFHEMSIFLLCQFLVFAQLLRFSAATVPPLNLVSLPQTAVVAIPSLELNGNLTLPPSSAATT